MMRTILATMVTVLLALTSSAQDTTRRSLIHFYRANYVIAGFNRATQVKFQFSVRYRLLQEFPVYMFYTQKSFWDLYDWDRSTPFRESNYNPGLFWEGVGQPGGVLSLLRFGVDHDSNGKDGTSSRGWNRVFVEPELVVVEGAWTLLPRLDVPFAVADENKDILNYLGPGEITVEYVSSAIPDHNRFRFTIRKGRGWNWDRFSWHADWMMRPVTALGIAPFGVNPSLYIQIWQGYGESLIDYNVSLTRVRLGIQF